MLKGNSCIVYPLESKHSEKIEIWRRLNTEQSPYLGFSASVPMLEFADLFKRSAVKSYLIDDNDGNLIAVMLTTSEDQTARSCALYVDARLGKDESSDLAAAQGVCLLIKHLFDEQNMHRIYTHVLETQEAISKLFSSLGFIEEVVLKEHYFTGGKYIDVTNLGLLKNEFKPQL